MSQLLRRAAAALWDSRRAAIFDLAVVCFVACIGHILMIFFPLGLPAGTFDWLGGRWVAFLLGDVSSVALLARRRYAVAVMAVATVLSLAQVTAIEFAPGPLLPLNPRTDAWTSGLVPWAAYAVSRYATGWRRVTGWTLLVVTTIAGIHPWDATNQVIFSGLVTSAFPTVLGLFRAARYRLMDELRDRAERAEREQHLLAEQARADERARLASEMHDVVTHRLSLMVLQAGALGLTARDEHIRTALEELRTSGCQALEEMRDLVGVLRNGAGGSVEPVAEGSSPPELDQLVANSRAVGVSVEFLVDGDSNVASPTVARTAYRVVQEALTNVHKHAPGAQVQVSVRYGSDRLRLTVHNTAPPELGPRPMARSGAGAGLLGLRQRVEFIGGSLHADAVEHGGFEVDAILPVFVPTDGASDE